MIVFDLFLCHWGEEEANENGMRDENWTLKNNKKFKNNLNAVKNCFILIKVWILGGRISFFEAFLIIFT